MKRLKTMMIVLACMLGIAAGTQSWAGTLYFVNTNKWGAVKVYAEKNGGSALTETWPGSSMTKVSGLQYGGYDVYRFDYTGSSLTKAVFNNGSNGEGNQTVDCTSEAFSDGSYFICRSDKDSYQDNKYKVEVFDINKARTVDLYLRGDMTTYVDDSGIHQWGVQAQYKFTKGAEDTYTLELPDGLTDQEFKIGDADWAFSFTSKNKSMSRGTHACIYDKSSDANMAFAASTANKVVLTYNLHAGQLTISEVVDPVAGKTVYFDFGEDRQNKGDLAAVPKVYVWPTKQSSATTPASSGYRDMHRAPGMDEYHDLWYYVIPDGTTVGDISFLYKFSDKNEYEYYTAGLGTYNDHSQLTDYIYYANNGHVASQSYITYEQYMALRSGDKPALYLLGSGLTVNGKNIAWPSATENFTWRNRITSIEAENNVFYLPVKFNDDLQWSEKDNNGDRGAAFKMSWINPVDYIEDGKQVQFDRGWATFNLGIVGYATKRNIKTAATMTDAGDNWNVHCKTSYTYRINNHNQYNWFIKQSEAGSGDYTLIVDIGPECQSATLLSFEPHPQVIPANVSISKHTLTDYMEADTPMNATGVNGKIMFKEVNVAAADISISTADGNDLTSNRYTCEYQLYANGESVGEPVTSVTGLRMPCLALGHEATLGVRSHYLDEKTGFGFHTKYSENEVNVPSITLNVPELSAPSVKTFTPGSAHYDKEIPAEERWYTLGAYVELPVTHTESSDDRAFYVDFKVESNDGYHTEKPELANGGELVHTDHSLAKSELFPDIKGLDGWTKYEEGAEFADAHNWSAKLAATDSWPLHLPEVVKVTRDKDNVDTSVPRANLTIKARYLYPFLIDRNATITTGGSAKAPARADTKAAPDYVLSLMEGGVAQLNDVTLGKGELTGIEEVAAETDAPVEYYNMQGMKMQGELPAGIYLRRHGDNKAEKIIIRY